MRFLQAKKGEITLHPAAFQAAINSFPLGYKESAGKGLSTP